MRSTTISLWLLSPLISSCAARSDVVRTYESEPDRIRAAIRTALGSFETVEEKDGVMTTGWSEETFESGLGVLSVLGYRYRVRHNVFLWGTKVAVRSVLERKASGGPRSRSWERVDGREEAENLMNEIERHLEAAP